ncbi:hypothetical protein GUJ93_ZPchr0002g23009 [Zizania palustris]|uniref:Uncharacterized protein n=1 Tax=Zizania palustris TaxID=103762 RepID=A0A8J5VCH5_ZIZPA|nr:hypothetical protein GUJ93_ZPchr0002g23009 [Zizania palustris]
MFNSYAALRPYHAHLDDIYKDFTYYKFRVPVAGAIILDDTYERVTTLLPAAENGGRSSSDSEMGNGSCAATGNLLERRQDFRRDDGCTARGERPGLGLHGMGRERDGSNRGEGITSI